MDKIDYKILSILKENARAKASEISKQIHLSVSSVIDRIRKMESSGVIVSYTVVTDDSLTGNDLTAFMEITLEHPRYSDSFVKYVKENPNIISCYYMAGEFDYLIKICCHSSKVLEEIHGSIKQQEGVKAVKARYILRTEKNIYTALPWDCNKM